MSIKKVRAKTASFVALTGERGDINGDAQVLCRRSINMDNQYRVSAALDTVYVKEGSKPLVLLWTLNNSG